MIEIRNLTKKRADTGMIKKLYSKIFFNKKFELGVVLANPALMRKLNKQWRGKDKIADVLSFLYKEEKVGEIFLNASLPRRQAGRKNLPYLFVHGSLHLLGYSHKKNRDAKKMNMKELNILNKTK